MIDDWLVDLGRAAAPRLELWCFAHAGGQPAAYAAWSAHLPPDVAVRGVLLPGRATRLREAPIADRAALVAALTPPLEAALARAGAPVVFFGHSMGAVLAFELCRRLSPATRPALLVVAAHRPPHRPLEGPAVHRADDGAVLAALHRLGATPPEVLAEAEVMALLLPMIRADHAVAETWCPGDGATVDVPLLALGGWDDPEVDAAGIEGWRRHTTAGFDWAMCDGDHFFVHDRPGAVWAAIRAALERNGDCGL